MFNKTYKNAGCSVYVYASLFLPVFTFTKADCTLLIISFIPCKKWISESKRWCGSGLVYIFFTASTWLWFREFFVFDVHLWNAQWEWKDIRGQDQPEKVDIPSPGPGQVTTPDGAVQVFWGLFHEYGESGAWDWQMDWGSINNDVETTFLSKHSFQTPWCCTSSTLKNHVLLLSSFTASEGVSKCPQYCAVFSVNLTILYGSFFTGVRFSHIGILTFFSSVFSWC